MRRFLLKLFFFIVSTFGIIYVLNSFYIKTNAYKRFFDNHNFDEVPEELVLANLGSSHGQYSFCYDKTNIKAYNFAMSAQGFYYDFELLQQFIDHFKRGSVILIPVSYFSFSQYFEDAFFPKRNYLYYPFLEPSRIYNFNYKDYYRYKLLPILTHRRNIKYIIKDIETSVPSWATVQLSEKELEISGKLRADYHKKIWIEKYGIMEQNKTKLTSIINFCYMHNLKPVLITTPCSKCYNKHFSDEFYFDFDRTVRNLAEINDVPYWDYSRDAEYCDELSLFFESNHLNSAGREKFTADVISRLRKEGLLQ